MAQPQFSIDRDTTMAIVAPYKTKEMQAFETAGGLKGLEKSLATNLKNGLSGEEASDNFSARRAAFGSNVYPKPAPRSWFSLLLEALKDTTLLILMGAAALSLILGVAFEGAGKGWIEGVAIFIAVAVVSVVTATNNWLKDRQFRKLNDVKDDKFIRVMRDGRDQQIKAADIVVGDVVVLTTGCQVPADGWYIDGDELAVDESVMTGEPEPPHKNHEEDPFLLSGTQVAVGTGKMLVMAVGADSEWGKTMAKLSKPPEETPLQQKLDVTAKFIGKIGLSVASLVFILLFIFWIVEVSEKPWVNSFLVELVDILIIAVTVVVVAVPEGLPLAVTLSLAYSMRQMMSDANLVRHLSACETMGGATNICSDKTGTLTENRMSVRRGWIAGKRFNIENESEQFAPSKAVMELTREALSVNSTAQLDKGEHGEIKYIGAPTECALLVFNNNTGADYLEIRKDAEERIHKPLYPFSSAKKRMSTVLNLDGGGYRIHTKGAAEMVLSLCTKYVNPKGNIVELTDELRHEIDQEITLYAGEALRNIVFAYRDLTEAEAPKDWTEAPEKDLVMIGLVGILDPVREAVPGAVKACQDAGIIVRMVTGDNLLTAMAIAKRCGILKEWGVAMEGPDFAKLSYEEIDDILPRLQVLARSSPTDKFTLVTRLRHNGEVVAVTGDGTNDAPALKAADVGLAMGIAGTEVAKEAAGIIILDDNFKSIEKSVLWGRSVFDNIRKFLVFQLTINLVALIVAFVGALTGRGTPLTAVQLLWVNLIMDTFAALALATEKPTPQLMERKPYGRDTPLLSPTMIRNIVGAAIFQVTLLFFILYAGHLIWNVVEGTYHHYTILFNTFVFAQFFNQFNARKVNSEYNVYTGLLTNPLFMGVQVFIVLGQALIVEFGGDFTKTHPLDVVEWFSCIGIASLMLPLGFLIRLIPVPKTKTEKMPNPNYPEEYMKKSKKISA